MRGIGVVIALVMATAIVRAETPQEKADKLFTQGRDLIKAGDAKGACEKFEQAIALDSNAPGVMLNLGLCYEKLGRLATSLRWYRKAQFAASEAKPRLTEYEEAATLRTGELAAKVAVYRLDVSAAPADVEVRVDGDRVNPSDYAKLELDAGSRQLEARASGKTPYATTLVIVDGKRESLAIPKLEDAPVVVVPTLDPHVGRKRRIIGIGLGVIGLGTAITIPFVAKRIQSDFFDTEAPDPDPITLMHRDEKSKTMKILGVAWFAGLAAIGAGAYLYFTAPSASESRVQAIVPVLTPDQAGVAVTGRF
jgi:tetratricopeptide (TPR) repeat protein